jgi:hypothetical protein
MRIDQIDPAESAVITFDFSPALDSGETLQGVITTTVTTIYGDDVAANAVLNGVSLFANSQTAVLVPVRGGKVDCDYAIKVIVGTTNPYKKLALIALLPVREDI